MQCIYLSIYCTPASRITASLWHKLSSHQTYPSPVLSILQWQLAQLYTQPLLSLDQASSLVPCDHILTGELTLTNYWLLEPCFPLMTAHYASLLHILLQFRCYLKVMGYSNTYHYKFSTSVNSMKLSKYQVKSFHLTLPAK